jgi:hypothetical protein
MRHSSQPVVEVNLEELDQIIDSGKREPLSEQDGEKLKEVLHALAERVAPRGRTTEKTRDVVAPASSASPAQDEKPAKPGHGRRGEAELTGARRVVTPHEQLQAGERCPECAVGKLYRQQPHTRIRFVGQAPLQATVYEMERLRCMAAGRCSRRMRRPNRRETSTMRARWR